MDKLKYAYAATAISVLFCIALAVYNAGDDMRLACGLTLMFMLLLFLFLGLCLLLKMVWQALLSRHL